MPSGLSGIDDALLELLSDSEEKFRVAFLNFVQSGQDPQVIHDLMEKLAEQEIEHALEIVHTYIENFANVVPSVFNTVGEAAAQELTRMMPNISVAISFNPTNPRAAELVSQSRWNMIRDLSAQQDEAIRQAISRSLAEGAGTAETARAIRQSIGLTSNQEAYVQSYRELLQNRDARALERDLRDRRFDAQINTAIRRERPLTDGQIDAMVERYRERALMMRADTIARTESVTALNQAREEALQQMVERTRLNSQTVTRVWRATLDDRVRDWHLSMDGQEQPMGEPFTDGLGNQLMYPGDPSAPAESRINCFPGSTNILPAGTKRVIESHYSGELCELSFAGRVDLAVTPNHPILTRSGWKRADQLSEGEELVYCRLADSFSAFEPNVDHRQSRAERLAYLARIGGHRDWARGAAVNLHGETPINQEVEIVTPPSGLRDRWHSTGAKLFGQLGLVSTDAAEVPLLAERLLGEVNIAVDGSSCAMGAGGERQPLIGGHSSHAEEVGFADRATGQSEVVEAGVDDSATNPGMSRDPTDRLAVAMQRSHLINETRSLFLPVRVTSIRRRFHHGLVYNFETDTGIIIAEGIVSHNCRCTLTFRIDQAA